MPRGAPGQECRPSAPDEENFCAIPLLKDVALAVDDDPGKGQPAEKRKRLEALRLLVSDKAGRRLKLTNVGTGKRVDLKEWAVWLRKEGPLPMPADSGDPARDLLAALSKHDGVFRELAAGLHRPKAFWTPAWKTRELARCYYSTALPHYAGLSGVEQTLALRADAAARSGDTVKAHESALVIARLSEASLNDPFLISLLVGSSSAATLCGVTWELCDAHAGTAEDFARLESALRRLDLHEAALHAWRAEMAGGPGTLQCLKVSRVETASALGIFGMDAKRGHSAIGEFLLEAIPSGFFDASSAVLADCEFRHVIKPLRDQDWAGTYQGAQQFEDEIIRMKPRAFTHPSWIMTAVLAPAPLRVLSRAAYTQALVDQAIVACALERQRIQTGGYPETLQALKLADGKPLPLDFMSGKPLGYRKTSDGKYALWNVGFDRTDDGGKRVLDEKHPENTKFADAKYAGDWVWDFPSE